MDLNEFIDKECKRDSRFAAYRAAAMANPRRRARIERIRRRIVASIRAHEVRRFRLGSFDEDWNAPGMEAYDSL